MRNKLMVKIVLYLTMAAFLSVSPGCIPISIGEYNKYQGLVEDYNSLVLEHNKVLNEYNRLVDEHNNKIAEVKDYLEQLEKQFEGTASPPYLLVKNRKISLVFRNLNGQIESWEWGVEALEASIMHGYLMRELSFSDMRQLGLNQLIARFPSNSKYVQLKDQGSYVIDCEPYVMENVFGPLALNFYLRHSDDEKRIKEVWNMVTQLATYSEESKETPRLPLETLLEGGGDCEDLAILTASMLRAMNADWKVSLVYMDGDNPGSLLKVNHVTVYVDTGKYKTFVESTNKYDMCPWQQVDGFYRPIK